MFSVYGYSNLYSPRSVLRRILTFQVRDSLHTFNAGYWHIWYSLLFYHVLLVYCSKVHHTESVMTLWTKKKAILVPMYTCLCISLLATCYNTTLWQEPSHWSAIVQQLLGVSLWGDSVLPSASTVMYMYISQCTQCTVIPLDCGHSQDDINCQEVPSF